MGDRKVEGTKENM